MTFRQWTQRIRVPAGFVLVPLLIFTARPTAKTLLAGAVVAAAGLSIRAWASGFLRKNEELATSGPYAHTRNPLYFGTLLLGLGIAISSGSLLFIGVFTAFYLLIYIPVMQAEAETVRALFPEAYEHYSRYVPLFVPRLTPYRAPERARESVDEGAGRRRFDLSRYLRHREYRAALGTLAVYAVLAAKLLLSGGQ